MPDITQFDYVPNTNDSGIGDLGGAPQDIVTGQPQTAADFGLNAISKSYDDLLKHNPVWNKQNILNQPYKTRLDDTLRYTDPNIGFNPFDDRLEFKYADAHPAKTLGNNLLQGGAKFLGTALETIATIPLALSGKSMYDNEITNGINDWLTSLNTSLPVYTSEYEQNHPILKYLTPWKASFWGGALGGAINNLGFTAGAIAGSYVTMMPFGWLGSAFKLSRMFGSFGRAIVTDAAAVGEEAKAAEQLLLPASQRGIGEGLVGNELVPRTPQLGRDFVIANGEKQGITQLGKDYILSEGKGIESQSLNNINKNIAAKSVNDLDKSISTLNTIAKIRDWTQYNLSLLTASMAEGSFEANNVMTQGRENLAKKFYDQYGRSPVGNELNEISSTVKDVADFTMGANIALLYLNNRIVWGSMFKPGKAAEQEVVDGIFKNIGKRSLQQNAESGLYQVVNRTAETKLGKLLLNFTHPGRLFFTGLGEGFEEGAQFVISEGATDYANRKFDAANRGEVADYMKSFFYGLNRTIKSNDGWDNIMGGFVGGLFGEQIQKRIEKSRGVVNSPLQRLQQQADLMNSANLSGLFEHKVQEAAVNNSLAKDYKAAVETDDKFKASNLKHQMLFNYVNSAVKADRFDMRIDELNAAKGLKDEEFKKMWGVNYSRELGQTAGQYLDSVIQKAHSIKADIDKVNRVWQNSNPFDAKKQSVDYHAYDSYKDQLALNLSTSKEYQRRMTKVEQDLKAILPNLNVQRALEITSVQGMRDMLTRLQTKMNDLAKQESEAQGNEVIAGDFKRARQTLKGLFDELQPQVLEGFNAAKFLPTLEKLYKLYNGVDDTNNELIEEQKRIGEPNTLYLSAKNETHKTHEQLADALQQLQDIRKLAAANFGVLRYYNYLQTGVGQREYIDKIKQIIQDNLDKLVTDENGRTLSPQEVENKTEEETRFAVGTPDDIEETTAKEREVIRKAAKKVVKGEKLSEEEKGLTDVKPNAYTNEVKIQQITTKEVTKRTGKPVAAKQEESTVLTEPQASKDFIGIDPRNTFGMFSQDKNDVAFRSNLYDAIFKSGLNEVFKNIKALYKKPNVDEVKFTKIPGTQLYRSTFTENVVITHNGSPIGIMRPADSVWLDGEGKRSIYDLKADEYQAVTGNSPETYDSYMASIRAYQTQYNALSKAMQTEQPAPTDEERLLSVIPSLRTKDAIASWPGLKEYLETHIGKKVYDAALKEILDFGQTRTQEILDKKVQDTPFDYNRINQYFALTINPGSRVDNKGDEKHRDTVLRDLNYKPAGTALISFIETITANGNTQTSTKTNEPSIVNADELTPQQRADLEAFIQANLGHLQKNFNRYVVALPINGKYTQLGLIAARNAETTNDQRADYYKQVRDVASGMYDNEQLNTKIQEINDKFFIANANRSVKQTFIQTLFAVDGDLVLSINNPSLKVYKHIYISKEAITSAKSFDDLITKMQSAVYNEEHKDAGFAKLKIVLDSNALRQQVPTDTKVNKLSEVEDRLKLSTSADVFENYNINFTPREGAAAASPEVKPVAPTAEEVAQQGIKDEYEQKRREVNSTFQTSLTATDKAIKDYISKNPTANTSQIAAGAKVTNQDVANYSSKVATFNEHTRILRDIEKQKAANVLSRPVFAETKAGISVIMKDLFNLPQEQADAVAEIYDLNATAWAKRTGQPKEAYYKQLGFKNTLDNNLKDILEQGDFYKGVQDIVKYLGLEFKQAGSNFGGYVKNGLTGQKLADRVGDVIKEQGLQNQVGAQWDKTHNIIVFRNKYPQLKNTLFQIAGEKGAQRFNNELTAHNLEYAKLLENDGESTDQIFWQTGWERGKDGKWRYDLKDVLTLNTDNLKHLLLYGEGTLEDIIHNPDLFKAYPELKNIKVGVTSGNSNYSNAKKTIQINNDRLQFSSTSQNVNGDYNRVEGQLLGEQELKDTLIHEIQHAIQAVEGFAKGGNTDMFKVGDEYYTAKMALENLRAKRGVILLKSRELRPSDKNFKAKEAALLSELQEADKGIEILSKALSEKSTHGQYRKLAGEVEARNAINRASTLTNAPISSTEDIDRESQHAVFHNNTVETEHKQVTPEDFYAELAKTNKVEDNPLTDNKILNGNVNFSINVFEGQIRLDDFVATEKGKGAGTAALKAITDTADKLGVQAELHAKPFGQRGMDKARLVEFYKKNGFQVIRGQYGLGTEKQILKYVTSKIGIDEGVDMIYLPKSVNVLYQNEPQSAEGIVPQQNRPDSTLEPATKELLAYREHTDNLNNPYRTSKLAATETTDNDLLNQQAKAAYNTLTNTIYALTNPDVSSPLHELAHSWEQHLTDKERQQVLDWAKVGDTWSRETSEKFARGFENYLAEGKAPTTGLQALFDKFAKWLAEVYKNIKQAFGDVQLNDEMRKIYARMLGVEEAVAPKEEVKAPAAEAPSAEQVLNTPLANREDFGTVSKIQQAYQDGYYLKAIQDKTLTEQQVRDIFKSAGMAEGNVDRIMFNLSNKDLIQKLAEDIPAGINAQYLRSELGKAIKDGRFATAIENGTLSVEKAKQILDYFGINQKQFKEAFDKANQPIAAPATEEAAKPEEEPEVTNYEDLTDKDVPAQDTYIAEEPQQDQYVQYSEAGVTKYAKVISQEGLVSALEYNGHHFDKLTDRLQPATEEQYKKSLPEAINIPDAKYKLGDHVVYGQDNTEYTITGAKQVVRPKDEETKDVVYTTAEGVNIIESGIKGKARVTPVQKVQQIRREHLHRQRVLQRIGDHFQRLFPQIKYEVGYFDFNAPARFYKGVAQINVGFENKLSPESIKTKQLREGDIYLRRETVAHEFMHPFILVLKQSSPELHANLVKELNKTQPEIVAQVNSLVDKGTYSAETKDDEALAIYLGHEITKAFDKNGVLDKAYVADRKKNLVTKFINWLQDMWDYLTGRKKPVSLEEFINRANVDVSTRKDEMRRVVNSIEELKKLYTKQKSDIDRTVKAINREIDGIGIDEFAKKYGINDEQKLNKLSDDIDDYLAAKPTGKFQFSTRQNENHGVEFEEADDKVKVFIDPRLVQDMSAASIIEQYGDRLTDNDLVDEYKSLVRRNFYQKGAGVGTNNINVKQINPFMRLQDVSDFLVSQLSEGPNVAVQYTGDELTVIDQLEAYMDLTDDQAKVEREKILKKLNLLKDTSTRRLNNDVLQLQHNVLSKLNLDSNDIDFVLKYVEHGTMAINMAWRKYNEIRQDLEDKENLTKPKLNRLSKELEVVKQLLSFYDDVSGIYNNYEEMFDKEDLNSFRKATIAVDRVKHTMANTAAELATEWLYPYVEKNNEYLAKQGYTDPKYTVSREEFKNNLLYGTNKDIGFLTFQLGAMVTSRDPVNAAFANTVADSIHLNHADINDNVHDYMQAYKGWLKRTGIGDFNEKAQIDYYEKNYLRKAKIWTAVDYDHEKNEPIYGYVEKSAFHQDYLYDQIDDDVRKFKNSLPEPKNSEEYDAQLVKVAKYRKDIKEQYANTAHAKLKNDPYFKHIEQTYNAQNAKYGKDALQYGIVPQLYRSSTLKQAAQKFAQAWRENDLKENVKNVSQYVSDKLARLSADNKAINLDGTVYRIMNKELANIKDDDKVEKNLQISMVDFIIDASRYGSLKEIQWNAENLRMLIEGNTKFNVAPRKIGAEDLIGAVRDRRALAAAKVKLAELEKLKRANDPAFNQAEYDELKAKIAKGIAPRSVWDKFIPRLKQGQTEKLNKQLVEMLNDVFYGEAEFASNLKIGNQDINLNKVGAAAGIYTSTVSMAFNRVAGLANVLQGDTQMWIEALGGKHYNLKDVAWATGHYFKNVPQYMGDIKNPIHSKDTQLALKYDAIQGEYEDEYGVKVSGNVMRRMLKPGSLFFMTKLGEHQIQLTGMLSLMHAWKVQTKDGKTINLYDAYIKDANGRYNLRPDVKFDEEDQLHFKRTLHGINRSLNGNYNELHKGHLQRTWYGKQLIRFRKWIYEGFRARWASEHTDFEKNVVEQGYLNYFLHDYLYKALVARDINIIKRYKDLSADGKYRVNKATAEIALVVALSLLAIGIRGTGDHKKKLSELSDAEKAVLLFALRLRGDYTIYHANAPSEAANMFNNPSASVSVAKKVLDVLIQLKHPGEVYEKDYGIYHAGDNKLDAKLKRIVPFLSKAKLDWDSYLKYYNLTNRDVK